MSRPSQALCALLTCLVLVAAGARSARAQADQLSNVKGLVDQATAAFEQLDYENTIRALDSAIGAILARPTEEVRRLLPGAYEMRAKAQFGLNKEAEARADLLALFKADPGYTLTGQNSPRFLAIADEILAATVTDLRLSVVPPDADVLLDGVRIPATGTLKVAVGDHTLSASRIGYKPRTQPFSAKAGEATVVDLFELERVSTVLRFVTAPPNVEVLIDGISHGRTQPGPPPAEYAERAARVGIPAAELSAVLTVTEIPIGAHRITYRRPCYVTSERQQTIEQLADYVFEPVKLEPAVATLAVTSNQAGTIVLVDGQQRGVAPITITDVCEGEHLVELKSASGRDLRRVDVRTGQRLSIEGLLRPAFAIVSTSGPAALNTDLRITIEKQLQSSRSVMLFAPPAEAAARALAAEKLPPDWLAFDQNRRPLGTAADVAQTMRAELARKLAKQFEAQGIASVTVPSPTNRNRLIVALLADGSGEPDILDVNLDSPESLGQAVARLDRTLSFVRPSIGVTVVDVADLDGPVVVGVEPGGPAAKSGVQVGDVLLRANGQEVPDAGALATLLADRKADENLTLELKDKTGASKRADVRVFMTPRLLGLNDQSLMINRLLVDLRGRLGTPADPALESVMRLNMAVALVRVGAWADARAELQRAKLADGPGVANGTVLYLLGLVAERLGNLAEAEQSWRAAAATPALLTEDGPPVRELAEARLAELQKRPRGGQ